MRYKLNNEGYVCAVSFGCYLDNCAEYTGEVPAGYKSLDEWASYSCIQAYYIDSSGNLVLDSVRKTECENRQQQEAIDYSPVLRKDLYGTDEVLDSQYVRLTETGKVIVLDDIKTVAPKVKITGVNASEYDKLSIYTQGKNMMPCNAVAKNICGVTFSKNASGSITVLGTATENIEYVISDGNTTPIFALKENADYYLNLGGLKCELRYFDGETTAQQYIGNSGLLNLPESIKVTQVVIKIASGDPVNTTFYPQLECGNVFTSYETYKSKSLEIDISKYKGEELYPSDTLYAEDTLYPGTQSNVINYILVENGVVTISVNDEIRVLGSGAVGLFSDYSTVYSTEDVMLELEYSTNLIYVDDMAFLQGKATTTNQFKILKDGSIEAHNGYFSGKIEATSGSFKGKIEAESGYFRGELKSATGEFDGKVTAKSGEIGGFTIKDSAIYKNTISLNSALPGVYIGTDGINLGGKSVIKSDGKATFSDVEIKGTGSLDFTSGLYSMSLDGSGIEFVNGIYNTKITYDKVQVYNTYMDADGLHVKGLYNYYTHIKSNQISFGSGDEAYIYHGTKQMIQFSSIGAYILSDTAIVGKSTGKVGFFSNSGSTKKNVTAIASTTSATASTVATKLNELINALKSYNLI